MPCLFINMTFLKFCKSTKQIATQSPVEIRKEGGVNRELDRIGSFSLFSTSPAG